MILGGRSQEKVVREGEGAVRMLGVRGMGLVDLGGVGTEFEGAGAMEGPLGVSTPRTLVRGVWALGLRGMKG